MADKKTLTLALMDPPYENARSTTALRLIHIAAKRGYDINVFAYEGSVFLAFAKQKPHPNAMHGRNVEEENHVLTKDLVSSLIEETKRNAAGSTG
jgi:tRNA 2-thiouridine synthesizing protein D